MFGDRIGAQAPLLVATAAVAVPVAVLIAALSIPSAAAGITQRQTNVDDVAAVLNRDARRGDFIVVYPWYIDTSFSMYYSGAAEWQSLPPIADHSVQRLDLAARAAMSPGVEAPAIERAATAGVCRIVTIATTAAAGSFG